MDFKLHCRNPSLPLSPQFSNLSSHHPNPFLCKPLPLHLKQKTRKNSHQKLILHASSNTNSNGSDGFSWSEASKGLGQFWANFGEFVKKETGFDLGDVNIKVVEFVDRFKDTTKKGEVAIDRFRVEMVPAFVRWNSWELWKDYKNWKPRRIATLILYIFFVGASFQGICMARNASRLNRSKRELTEAFMEALIPDPTPSNVRKFKKSIWRTSMPKGLKIKKFIEGPGGELIQDHSYVGEDAWDDDLQPSQQNLEQIIDSEESLNSKEKDELKKDFGIAGEDAESNKTWSERLVEWKQILRNEKFAEQVDSLNAKYVVDFDMQEVEKSLRKDVAEKAANTPGNRALWISKRWWRYRPKLPYTYFLQKLDSSEVAAVVFTEDLKKLYVTMKEGFPLEFAVDIPLDPYLFEIISSSGVEVDLLQKRQIHYFLRLVVALVPGLLILYLIRESVMVLHVASSRYLYKRYKQLFDIAYADNFIMPMGDVADINSMHKDIILGGDVWDLLDELMIYMGNPMQYYEREVPFVRGVLLHGPPGTGKTLFARTLAKESGMPFVFASGAEFTDSEKSGAARINEIFSIARRNAPSFIFLDEIDAIAGRYARKDSRQWATFQALIAQLDGDKEKVGVDRFSLRQAVIFICATNRPDELDLEFLRAGRIDRRLYIGLPDVKQRVKIFGVHSTGKQLAEDVDFEKLVFRTVGYSGADIRNLVNEAGIMSVRKGHAMIFQQDIIDVLDKQLLEGMGVLITEEEQQKCEESVPFEKKRLLAVHEAGHILLAHMLPSFDWHAFSQLLPGGKETAMSVFYPREDMVDQGYTTFGYMKMQMVVAHGGRCAERVVFGDEITDGGSDDLRKITRIAREMVISPKNTRLGLASLIKRHGQKKRQDNPDDELIKFKWDDPRMIPTDMTVEVSELFTRELTRYIEETEELAMSSLKKNRHLLDLIADELLEKSRITGLEVQEKLKGVPVSMFEDFVEPFQIHLEEDESLPLNSKLRYQPLDVYPAPLHRC